MSELKLNEFLKEFERLREKETKLTETIQKQNEQIMENETTYKDLLRAGKENEADELYKQQYELKLNNQSNHAKLKNLKPIHQELLIEKVGELLDNDLPELTKTYEKKMMAIIQKRMDLEKKLKELNDDEDQLREEIRNKFLTYDSIAEEFGMRKLHRSRFYQEPYDVLNYPASKIYEKANRRVQKNG